MDPIDLFHPGTLRIDGPLGAVAAAVCAERGHDLTQVYPSGHRACACGARGGESLECEAAGGKFLAALERSGLEPRWQPDPVLGSGDIAAARAAAAAIDRAGYELRWDPAAPAAAAERGACAMIVQGLIDAATADSSWWGGRPTHPAIEALTKAKEAILARGMAARMVAVEPGQTFAVDPSKGVVDGFVPIAGPVGGPTLYPLCRCGKQLAPWSGIGSPPVDCPACEADGRKAAIDSYVREAREAIPWIRQRDPWLAAAVGALCHALDLVRGAR